jgi:hypothetical protein
LRVRQNQPLGCEVRHQETFVLEPLPRLRYGSTHLHTPMLWVCRRVRVPQRHLKVRKGHARATFLLDQLQEHDAHIFRRHGQEGLGIREEVDKARHGSTHAA